MSQKIINQFSSINGFDLVNQEKVIRAVSGNPGKGGILVGGVGEEASPAEVIAAYDKLGGLILKDGRKVKTGSFYDFDARAPRKTPKVILLINDLEGNVVEIPDGEKLSPELQAAETIAERKKAKRTAEVEAADAEKPVKKGKKSKATEVEE